MESIKKTAHFTPLSEEEKKLKLFELSQQKGELNLWKKGGERHERAKAELYDDSEICLTIKSNEDLSFLLSEPVLTNFVVKGQFFFTSGFLQVQQNGFYKFNLQKQFFRCERRKSFRLQGLHPHELKILFPIESTPSENVVLDFPRKDQEIDLKTLKKFIHLMDEYSAHSVLNHMKIFPIKDISTAGVAFFVSEYEMDFLQKNKKFNNFFIRLNKTIYNIPEGQVVNINPQKDLKRPLSNFFKVAIEFLNLPKETDLKISKQLNTEIMEANTRRSFEKLF